MLELDKLPISVVIPTYNNKKSFENVLDAVYKQTIRPKQIVINIGNHFRITFKKEY